MIRLLFLEHPEADFGSYFNYHGLCEILGEENIIVFPDKKIYRGLVADDYILDSGQRGYTDPPAYIRKREYPVLSLDDVIAQLDSFSLIVLAAPRTYAINALRQMKARSSNLPPIAFTDFEDSTTIRYDIIDEFKPKYIFKRELLNSSIVYTDSIYIKPLQFASICWEFVQDNPKKDIDVFFSAGHTWSIRTKIRNLLRNSDRLKNYKIDVNVDNVERDRLSSYREYLDKMSRARINITARGHGIDTVRAWETVTYSGLVLSDNVPLIIPNPFENEKNIVFYQDDLSDLIDKVIYYLENEQERRRIGEAGRSHCLRYHTTIARARWFLQSCNLL